MVFSGRPSTACEPCRKWRLRCDRAVPTCTQCIRKKIVCTGYRDPAELRLRNETERVTLKHQSTKKKTSQPSRPSKTQLSSNLPNSTILPEPARKESTPPLQDTTSFSLATRTLSQPGDLVALSYFMNAYIISSPFESYLPAMYSNSPVNDNLSSAIRAAAFATLSIRLQDAAHMKTARASYARALTQTNACLASPKQAVLDNTLAAVLVLGLFEAISFQGGGSPESWTAHTLGAVELLRLRGANQFQSKVASQLFMQTMINIRTSCIQRAVAVPQEFVKLHEETAPYLSVTDPSILIGPIIDRAASLRERSQKCPSFELIVEALTLDKEAVDFIEGLGPSFRFTTRSKEDTPPWAYLSIAHKYPNRRTAKFWNAIRMIRLFLSEMIGSWVGKTMKRKGDVRSEGEASRGQPFSTEFLENIQTINEINLAELTLGVLASVPEFIEKGGGVGTKFSLAARTLVWPLMVLYKCEFCDPLAKKYAVRYLAELGHDLNIAEAIDAARTAGEWRVEDWSHLKFNF